MVGLSEYEQARQRQIEENQKILEQLGVKSEVTAIHEQPKKPVVKHKPKKRYMKREETPPPPRKSMRIRGYDPDGEKVKEEEKKTMYDYGLGVSEAALQREQRDTRKEGPVALEDAEFGNEDTLDIKGFYKWMKQSNPPGSEANGYPEKRDNKRMDLLQKALESMHIPDEKYVEKLTPDRTYSIAYHPDHSKAVVVVGDKWGKIAFWDVENGEDAVYSFHPHSRPVSWLKFVKEHPYAMYSCSYDTSVRKMDMKQEIFDEVYVGDTLLGAVDVTPDNRIMYVGDFNGDMVAIDLRVRDSKHIHYDFHDKKIGSLEICPKNEHLVLTASNDTTARVWDVRKLKKNGRCHNIFELPHGKSVNGAQWSPDGTRIASNSMDNTVRLHDVNHGAKPTIVKEHKVSHNNHTGRWITKFRLAWLPSGEGFLSGAMNRSITCFDGFTGKRVHSISDELMSAIPSVNAAAEINGALQIAGSTGSGRVQIFKP
eukprot:Clim_evm8s175 gene=Clim_evmTU8s175